MADRDLIAEMSRELDLAHARIAELEQQLGCDRAETAAAVLNLECQASAEREADRAHIAELEAERAVANKALDEIARSVRPDDDGTWTDRDGLLESIGDTIESTGRKVWEVDTDV